MRALVAIPHYFAPQSAAARHDSLRPGARGARARALASAILRLHELFGADHLAACHPQGAALPAANPERMALDIVVCVQDGAHLLDDLPCPPGLFRRQPVQGPPQLLGFAAHEVLARGLGRYDWYCYLEDDIVVEDPLFFRKLAFFNRNFAAPLDRPPLLQPSRYDSPVDGSPERLGGPERLYPDHMASLAPLARGPRVQLTILDRTFTLEPCYHPHAGCFFLDARQMARLVGSPAFRDRTRIWATWLDTAASVAIAETFTVYKPAADSLTFLEVRHARPVMLDQLRPLEGGARTWLAEPGPPLRGAA
ncbi:MAG: hypothetical protein N3D77_13815 [Geminicoccaceae bacterium]|nr:hypothetical protein [Geminicoccaceae bacterium]